MFPLPTSTSINSATTALSRRSPKPRQLSLNRVGREGARRPMTCLTSMPRSHGLAMPGSARLSGPPTIAGINVPRPQRPPSLPNPRRFPVASLDMSKRDVGLPYGVPRVINAATLKRIAGARVGEQLLKNTPGGWVFVSDEALIDLTDSTQEYRVGRLAIFS